MIGFFLLITNASLWFGSRLKSICVCVSNVETPRSCFRFVCLHNDWRSSSQTYLGLSLSWCMCLDLWWERDTSVVLITLSFMWQFLSKVWTMNPVYSPAPTGVPYANQKGLGYPGKHDFITGLFFLSNCILFIHSMFPPFLKRWDFWPWKMYLSQQRVFLWDMLLRPPSLPICTQEPTLPSPQVRLRGRCLEAYTVW